MTRSLTQHLQRWAYIATFVGLSGVTAGCSSARLWHLPTTPINDAAQAQMPPVDVGTQTISLKLPEAFDKAGGLIAADVDKNGEFDLVVTQPGYIAAYNPNQGTLWDRQADIWLTGKSQSEGLPGLHGPGVQVGDVDNDEKLELLYLTAENQLRILDAASGADNYQIDLPPVDSYMGHWEHAVIANFRGAGDQDLLLQASRSTIGDRESYIRDPLQVAFRIEDLLTQGQAAKPLWSNEAFISLSHGSAKVMDINGDGKNEVVGAMILGSDGQELHNPGIENTAWPHVDSLAVDDIDPNRPGLEAVVPEESGDLRVILFDSKGTLWTSDHRRRSEDADGDKIVAGNFEPTSPGLEMWFRGQDSQHLTVLDSSGEVIASYRLSERGPEGWTEKGFEVIHRIQWTGAEKEYIVAKERHEAGDVGIFDAMTGQLVAQFPHRAERLYVADILGDWREEIIAVSNDEITIYQNQAPNPNPDRPSLWEGPLYRRSKMTWNYYSP